MTLPLTLKSLSHDGAESDMVGVCGCVIYNEEAALIWTGVKVKREASMSFRRNPPNSSSSSPTTVGTIEGGRPLAIAGPLGRRGMAVPVSQQRTSTLV